MCYSRNRREVFIVYMIWTQTSGLIGLNFFHYKIIWHLCNFPFWHRGQVFYRWRDSCGFMASASPNTLVFVTHRGPLSKKGKCPHAHLLSKKKKIDLNIWEKEKPCLTFIECERGSEENFLAQSRHWLYKKSFLITYSYENKTMVATCNSFKPGKSLTPTQQLKRGKHDMSTDERSLRTATETTRYLWKRWEIPK